MSRDYIPIGVAVDMRDLREIPDDDDHDHDGAHKLGREMGDALYNLRRMRGRLAAQPEAATLLDNCIRNITRLRIKRP